MTKGKKMQNTLNRCYFKRYLDKVRFSGNAYQYKILMEPQSKNWVFALDMPAAFERPLYKNGNYQLLTSESSHKRAEYEISSYVNYNTGYITKTELSDNLQLPKPVESRVKALVEQLGGFTEPPETFIHPLKIRETER